MTLDSCPNMALALAAALAHCMLGFKLWWTNTPTSFSYSTASSLVPAIVYSDLAFFAPRWRMWHFAPLKSICHSEDQATSFSMVYWSSALCTSFSTTLPTFVSSANFRRIELVTSTALSMSLMKMRNKVGPRTDP